MEQYIQSKLSEIENDSQNTTGKSQRTVISEVKAIDLILKVISLTDLLHSNQIIHTNLCPEEIFLRGESVDQMCFANLYHAHWNTKQVLKIDLPYSQETPLKFDIRTRNKVYISPEQVKIGLDL